MSATTDTTQNVRAELAALGEPLRQQIKELDKTIAARRAELDEMTNTRRDAAKALSFIDPTFEPKAKPGPKAKPPTSGYANGTYGVSPPTLASIREWLTEHVNGGTFTGTSLMEAGFNIASLPTLRNALNAFHDEGFIALDHRSKGGGKVYKLARA
jgi:hypothetical protein